MIIFGEIGLSGELRAVPQPNLRLKEASKLGFKKALTPLKRGTQKESPTGISITEVGHISKLIELFSK